jgi:hypothetical protein
MPKTASLREQFGQRLRALRLQHDLTQEQLAEAAEISVDFLSLAAPYIFWHNAPNIRRHKSFGVTR